MQSEKFDDLRESISEDMKAHLGTLREHAEHFAAQQVERMLTEGSALELSEDEERMLRAYRSFCSRSAPCSIFSWRSPDNQQLVLPSAPSLLVDPREVPSKSLDTTAPHGAKEE